MTYSKMQLVTQGRFRVKTGQSNEETYLFLIKEGMSNESAKELISKTYKEIRQKSLNYLITGIILIFSAILIFLIIDQKSGGDSYLILYGPAIIGFVLMAVAFSIRRKLKKAGKLNFLQS